MIRVAPEEVTPIKHMLDSTNDVGNAHAVPGAAIEYRPTGR